MQTQISLWSQYFTWKKCTVYLDLRIYIYREFQYTQLISLTTVSSVLFITVNERQFRTVFPGSVRLHVTAM